MHMKYIVVNGLTVFIFTGDWTHQNFAFNMNINVKEITSAGFFQISSRGARCYGESISLGKRSSPKDSALVNKLAGDNFDDETA